MQIVAGLNLKNLEPRIWDSNSPYYLPNLRAVMLSYADFQQWPAAKRRAMDDGLHKSLGIPKRVKIYLDNGAFYFSLRGIIVNPKEYEEFVDLAKPDWKPIPQDFIPTPRMSKWAQRHCLKRTMFVNNAYEHDGFVPVIHIGGVLKEYVLAIKANTRLAEKTGIALGGIVPHLLRMPKALPYQTILDSIREVRKSFQDKQLHLFGVGGTATLHLAALMGMDSVDSSGYRNRAARGMIQLPGSGERVIVELGSWRGRTLSANERKTLRNCLCPACQLHGIKGLKARGLEGFCNRATHNLWTLLEEASWIKKHLKNNTYKDEYVNHLDNTIYRRLVDYAAENLIQ
jgi:7-cyano-7-deazaguanine tRNA-ribosyltransferase